MSNNNEGKVIFITGAGRGMGTDIAKAALAAGHAVVATGRKPDAVSEALGDADNLLVVKLDVTDLTDANAAVKAAVERFGQSTFLSTTLPVFMQATSRSYRQIRLSGSCLQASLAR